MKTTLPTSFILAALFSPSAFALSLSDAPIQHVTLYPAAAKIERTLPVRQGENIVSLTGLAANFDMNQLQYQSSNIDINAVSHTDSALDKPAGQESGQLKSEIEQLRLKISEQNAIIQSAELQNKFLSNLTRGSASRVRKEAQNAFLAMDAARTEKEKLEQRVQELQQDLNSIGDHEFNQRILKFHVNAAKSGDIKISYMIPYARWQPVYKAELDTRSKQLKLTRMAMIAQKTGEDWNNVSLTLSTSMPQNYIQQIQPESWWVNYYEPEPVRPIAPAPVAAMAEMAYDDSASARKTASRPGSNAPRFPQFQATELNFSTEFRSDTQATVTSSQQQIFLPLSSEQHPAQLSIWAIPRQGTQASLNAEIPALSSNWPTGMIRLYRDGDYIGQRNWNQQENTVQQMTFGVDEQIKVKVTELGDKKSPSGTGQSETVQKQRYTIQNLHNYPVQLKLFESEPQSRNGKLVTHSTYSQVPQTKAWNNQPGISQWNIELAPKQIFELDVQHEFKYPSKGNTSGF